MQIQIDIDICSRVGWIDTTDHVVSVAVDGVGFSALPVGWDAHVLRGLWNIFTEIGLDLCLRSSGSCASCMHQGALVGGF